MYTEPPESMEHISDQAALPNLNAEWVNAKGQQQVGEWIDCQAGKLASAVDDLRRLNIY